LYTAKTAEFNYWLLLSFANFSKSKKLMNINCVVNDTSANCWTNTIVPPVQILMTCPICQISAVYIQLSGKAQISDIRDVNKSTILIEF